jgi:hypothetical protein
MLYAGGFPSAGGSGRSVPFIAAVLVNGSSSGMRVNGTMYIVSGDSGPNGIGNPNISDVTYSWKGALAFVGISDTELSTQDLIDLETWANTYYGVPIP